MHTEKVSQQYIFQMDTNKMKNKKTVKFTVKKFFKFVVQTNNS